MNFRRVRARSRKNSMNIMVSAEKWRTYGRKMSRRDSDQFTDDQEDGLPETGLEDWVEEFFIQKSLGSEQCDQDVEVKLTKKQTLILSTLVPDEILLMENFSSANPKRFVGVLMMADVSGYTALSEKYNNSGKGGTYRLTVTLNTYLGSLCEIIYSHGGDIIKFAGDAFLALWKTDKRTFLCHTIHTAIACALIIQHSYGSYETDVKVNLKVKLAISAGNLIFSPIGSGIDMNYIIIGLPVIEAKIAESLCSSGEVKVTPTAWGHCYSRNYDHVISDDGHVSIKAILYDPREKDVSKPFVGFAAMIRQVSNKPFVTLENLPDFASDATQLDSSMTKESEILSLRNTILLAEEKNIGAEIRKFMIRPVLTQIDAHQPLEYLTEMRQVSVLFVTLKPKDCPSSQLITLVDNSYKITCEIVCKSMGCVNKIILFDKDIMILVIFGLRGFKHESEAQAALKCAYSIKKSLSALDGVLEVSVGVTTGQVYCGVVGHPLRREFTVIGAIVNKAARFMCSFRNKITCDEATFIKSKMFTDAFTLQPPTQLKGINKPGRIYEYTEEIRVKELYNIPLISPLLNRSDEMEYFESWLDDYQLKFRDFDALLLIGEPRLGKTRLLEWMIRLTKNKDFKVCHLSLTSIHSATPYLALSQIIDQIIDFEPPHTGFEKEEKIVDLLTHYSEDLCYLNDIIKVRFAYCEGVYKQNEATRNEKAKNIFKKLIMAFQKACVIFLDDIHNLDESSWEFLTIMFESMNIFTIFTVTRGKFSSLHSWLYEVFIKSNIRKIVLGSLDSNWIAPLACQILDVDAVPNDLCNSLKAKCNGKPGLVESFIVHLFSSGALEFKKISKADVITEIHEDLQFPDPKLVLPVALNIKDQQNLDNLMEENSTDEVSVCVVIKKEELNTDINIQNIDALIMIQIDSLTPYQQLLLKIASVIGNILSRDLLENIMYENDPLITAKAVKRLFAMRILTCANIKSNRSAPSSIASYCHGSLNLSCDCCFEYDSESNDNLPKYAFCKVMKFRNKNSRQTFYDLLPLNQKKEFHSRIVSYLQNNKQKCPDCGGTIMVVQSAISLQSQVTNYGYNNKSRLLADDDLSVSNEECELDTVDMIQSEVNKETIKVKKSQSEALEDNKTKPNFINSTSSSRLSELNNTNVSQCAPILKRKFHIDDDIDIRRRSTKRVTMSNILSKNVSSEELKNPTIFDMFRSVLEVYETKDWHDLGIIDSQDDVSTEANEKTFHIKIEKGVSQINFKKCSCADLHITIYKQLIQHTKEAELTDKMVEFILQYSYLNILAHSFEMAIPKLDEAENICLDKKTPLTSFERKRFLGRTYSLKAATFLLSGRFLAAKINAEKACKIYNINLKNITNLFHFPNIISAVKLRSEKYRRQNIIMKQDSIFFLNVAAILYSTLEDQICARVAALRSLHLIQRVDCSFIDLCDALTNAIQIELDRGNPEVTANIEKIASISLKKFNRPIEAGELFSLGKLFLIIFQARSARGQITAAIRSGFRALVISRFLFAIKISVDIIPDVFYLLLSRCRIREAVDVIKLLLQLDENQTTLECETWYYALCMDMILDCGFQLESPIEISRFAEFSICKGKSAGESRRRLIVGVWTYWLRANFERRAKQFEDEALNWLSQTDDDCTLRTLISALRLAEGMLESLAKKVDDLRKVVDLMELHSLADHELSRLEKDARLLRTIYPRWMLIKAYSMNVSGRHSAANTLFNQTVIEARKIHNHLEEALTLAANSNSKHWIQCALTGQFLPWYVGAETAKKSWHQLLYKTTTHRE
ncbi:adenylate cyclase type 10-like [Danaus plexippus]|uniref:adenylate cyclase type 10-like n=1 Tax=Danaus plexippus TaxID=13037 RepID=UPI002AB22EE5|nr:adenylate cyclase type 10-like [Danaus plexippus]